MEYIQYIGLCGDILLTLGVIDTYISYNIMLTTSVTERFNILFAFYSIFVFVCDLWWLIKLFDRIWIDLVSETETGITRVTDSQTDRHLTLLSQFFTLTLILSQRHSFCHNLNLIKILLLQTLLYLLKLFRIRTLTAIFFRIPINSSQLNTNFDSHSVTKPVNLTHIMFQVKSLRQPNPV